MKNEESSLILLKAKIRRMEKADAHDVSGRCNLCAKEAE